MNLEWAVEHELTSDYGSIFFNKVEATTARVYRIQYETYKIIPSLRVTQDNISQADGSVLHPRWKSGLVAIINVALNVMADDSGETPDFTPACGNDLREMSDELLLHLNAIRQLRDSQRLYWTPTGLGDQQMLTDIELLAIWEPTYDLNGLEAMIQFAVETPFPYAIASTQQTVDIDDGGTMTLTNDGNCPFSPVIKVAPGSGVITITNNDDVDEFGAPLSWVYDSSRPGAVPIGGSYGEVDFFQGTIFQDGDSTDLIAGVSPQLTDYWHLNPGDNDISIDGGDCTILYNDAWA